MIPDTQHPATPNATPGDVSTSGTEVATDEAYESARERAVEIAEFFRKHNAAAFAEPMATLIAKADQALRMIGRIAVMLGNDDGDLAESVRILAADRDRLLAEKALAEDVIESLVRGGSDDLDRLHRIEQGIMNLPHGCNSSDPIHVQWYDLGHKRARHAIHELIRATLAATAPAATETPLLRNDTPRVSVYRDGVGEVSEPVAYHGPHICGSRGFGMGPDDTCARCEAEREAKRRCVNRLDVMSASRDAGEGKGARNDG